jgi:rod shape-determining protein MreC
LAPPRDSRFRPLLVLGVFLAGWWLAPVALRSFSRQGFAAFETPVALAYSRVKDLQDFWSLRDQGSAALVQAGLDLAHQNADLQVQLQQANAWRGEAARLGALLQMPPEPGFRYEFARVIRRDETSWWQQLEIRKGRLAGLAPGQGVVFAGGVVGRIQSADDFTAVVELASSPTFRVAANLGTDTNPVIYQGLGTQPPGSPGGEVREVPPGIIISEDNPARLVTSSLGGVFPQGLTLGDVGRLEPGSDGLFQAGAVRLDPELATLREVAVLVPIPASEYSAPPPTQKTK